MRFLGRALTSGFFATASLLGSLASAAEPTPAPATSAAAPAAPAASVPPSSTPAPVAPAPPTEAPAPNPAAQSAPPAAPSGANPAAPAAPAAAVPAPAAPAPAPAAVPPVTPGISPAPSAPDPTRSFVHLASSYPHTALELKSSIDATGWQRACVAPCDESLVVAGMLARASAPGMTTSNAFRIQPGAGPAQVKVEGGSSSARTLGVIHLAAGIPVALGGAALFSYGKLEDSDAASVAGAVILGTGALAILVALPLLVSGKTNVRNADGRLIAGDFRDLF